MAFGFIHGFERVDAFWEAPDMDGVPVIGTYIIFVTRTIAAASLVGVMIYIVPRYHKQVAIVVASACIRRRRRTSWVSSCFKLRTADLTIGLDGWYRHTLDMLSIIFGATVGAWLAYQKSERGTRSARVSLSALTRTQQAAATFSASPPWPPAPSQ